MSLTNKIITPQSVLIEMTALELAATYYEVGRSQGLHSKYKNPRAFAKANVEKFIPAAVSILMDMLGSPTVSQDQKDLIYDAVMERTNDKELSNIGIKAFENPFEYKSDKHIPPVPVVYNTKLFDPSSEQLLKGLISGKETKN